MTDIALLGHLAPVLGPRAVPTVRRALNLAGTARWQAGSPGPGGNSAHVWKQIEETPRGFPWLSAGARPPRAGGHRMDGTLVTAHSDKEGRGSRLEERLVRHEALLCSGWR